VNITLVLVYSCNNLYETLTAITTDHALYI
jgi:hypothetical protein